MSTIRLAPNTVNVCDILEYALAAIEEYGWRQGPRDDTGLAADSRASWEKIVLPHGLSLHDAVGYACVVLSGQSGLEAAPMKARTSSKDYSYSYAPQHGYASSLRERASEAIQRQLPGAESDVTFNDKADDYAAVAAVLKAAIKEECN